MAFHRKRSRRRKSGKFDNFFIFDSPNLSYNLPWPYYTRAVACFCLGTGFLMRYSFRNIEFIPFGFYFVHQKPIDFLARYLVLFLGILRINSVRFLKTKPRLSICEVQTFKWCIFWVGKRSGWGRMGVRMSENFWHERSWSPYDVLLVILTIMFQLARHSLSPPCLSMACSSSFYFCTTL